MHQGTRTYPQGMEDTLCDSRV